MNFESITPKLAWAVLVSGVVLVALSGAFVLMTGNAAALTITAFAAVAAQAGKIALRDEAPATVAQVERTPELVAA